MPQEFTPYLERLRSELAEIRGDLNALLDRSAIRNVDPNTADSAVIFVGAAEWGWAPSDAGLVSAQMLLLARYSAWFDRVELLFPYPTPQMRTNLADADEFVRRWVERPDEWDHSIPRTIDEAKMLAEEVLSTFDMLLDIAGHAGTGGMRLVPDTNALIRNPDFASYGRVLPSSTFTVHLVPTVLSELDDLKDRGRTPELRERAQAVVRRLKGLRDKGGLAAGVKVTRSITVQTEAREVDVRGVLDWLDPAVPDDRILAASLRLQSDQPAGTVVLVTSDLNLQNKADAVALPYIETPPTIESLRADLSASSRWSQDSSPLITLTNNGPAPARAIEYSVATMPEDGPVHSTSEAWKVDRLGRGERDERVFAGFFGTQAMVTATWTDEDGSHERSWPIDFPDRPVVRRTRLHGGR